MKLKISILGCGWLGFPLAQRLLENGFPVKGSTTSDHKIPILQQAGIETYQIAVTPHGIEGNIDGFLSHADVLILDIPPKLRGENSSPFTNKIEKLIPFIGNSEIRKVIFTSSISVYADDNTIVTEATIPKPETESGKQLLQAETLLQSNARFKTTVIRFGGLIGEDRHPVKSLSGKENLANPDAPVNLIHQADCIGIIEKIIEKDIWGETFNAVFPSHPTREAYYHAKAAVQNLALPGFDHSKTSVGKTVDSKKITGKTGYSFLTAI